MRRGELWISSRFGHNRKVIVVGHDRLTAIRDRVLVVPISDVSPAKAFVPSVSGEDGDALGVAQIPFVGEVAKSTLIKRAGGLAPASIWSVDVALRAAFDLEV